MPWQQAVRSEQQVPHSCMTASSLRVGQRTDRALSSQPRDHLGVVSKLGKHLLCMLAKHRTRRHGSRDCRTIDMDRAADCSDMSVFWMIELNDHAPGTCLRMLECGAHAKDRRMRDACCLHRIAPMRDSVRF